MGLLEFTFQMIEVFDSDGNNIEIFGKNWGVLNAIFYFIVRFTFALSAEVLTIYLFFLRANNAKSRIALNNKSLFSDQLEDSLINTEEYLYSLVEVNRSTSKSLMVKSEYKDLKDYTLKSIKFGKSFKCITG